MLQKPPDVLARDVEWSQLVRLSASPTPELAFVLGRRRIGKSYLLARFARAVDGIYYQATRRTAREQLQSFGRVVGKHFGDSALSSGAGFSDWTTLLDYITAAAGTRSLVIVLDEFPYLSDVDPALTSIFQRFWDHDLADTRIKIVLSGSYASAMRQLERTDQPLYGRRTARIKFGPLRVDEAAEFYPAWSTADKLLAYGIFGHLPGNLSLIRPAETLAANVQRVVLDPSGRLADDALHLLDAFTAEAAVHYSIIEGVANGDTTWKKLTSRVGRSGGALSRPLAYLEGMDLLERRVPIIEAKPDRSKRVRYELTDPYLSFYHRIVAPLVHSGSLGLVPPDALWEESIAPQLPDHMGGVFEAMCRAYLRAGFADLPFRGFRVGGWWEGEVEVDVAVTGLRNQDLAVGEAKWGAFTSRHLATLRRRAARVAEVLGGGAQAPTLLAFSGSGRFEGVDAVPDDGSVRTFSGEDLVRAVRG